MATDVATKGPVADATALPWPVAVDGVLEGIPGPTSDVALAVDPPDAVVVLVVVPPDTPEVLLLDDAVLLSVDVLTDVAVPPLSASEREWVPPPVAVATATDPSSQYDSAKEPTPVAVALAVPSIAVTAPFPFPFPWAMAEKHCPLWIRVTTTNNTKKFVFILESTSLQICF